MEVYEDIRRARGGRPDPVGARVEAIFEYGELAPKFEEVEGFLFGLEGFALMQLAAHGEGEGAIVEIGSFQGRSTCWLASGAKRAGREHVTAVDHFKGSPEHQAGGQMESGAIAREGSTYGRFCENIKAMEVDDYVDPIVAGSAEAVQSWDGPIRLLFIDGDHAYETSKQDFELWSPFVVEKGVIAFHDVGTWPGVTAFYETLMKSTDAYEEVFSVLTLHVIQKMRRTGP